MEESLRDAAAGVYPGQKQAAADIQTEAGTMRPDLMLERLFDLPERDYSQYSPLTLAYMGDVVYDLVIRTILVRRGNAKPDKLHRQTASVVRATAQAAAIRSLLEEGLLTEEEAAVYRRGKNSKPYNTAKHATRKEYLEATGYEALLGYLYLKKEYARVLELVHAALLQTPQGTLRRTGRDAGHV